MAAKKKAAAKKSKAIDPNGPKAREKLVATYPRPTDDAFVQANREVQAAADAYFAARREEAAAKRAKDAAAARICSAIGSHLGAEGEGWRATWDLAAGSVDWEALVARLGISRETVEEFRRPSARRFDLREVA